MSPIRDIKSYYEKKRIKGLKRRVVDFSLFHDSSVGLGNLNDLSCAVEYSPE